LSWLDEKFVVAAAEPEGVVALLPTAPSPFRNNVRRRREREQFEHSPGHQEAMEVRLHNNKASWYPRRRTVDWEGERVDLSGLWNDLDEELEDEDEECESEHEECEDDEWEDEAPDAENAIKCKNYRHAKRARLAVAAQASERSLARRSTVSQGSSRDSNQSRMNEMKLSALPLVPSPLPCVVVVVVVVGCCCCCCCCCCCQAAAAIVLLLLLLLLLLLNVN
jgi:hypothetical protein